MNHIERRVERLEKSAGGGICCVALERGESLDQAMERLGIRRQPGTVYLGLDEDDQRI